MGLSDGEGADSGAEWDKSNVSSSSSSSASSNKSKSSKNSKSTNNSGSSASNKSKKSSYVEDLPRRKVTCEVSDDEMPPGTSVAVRPLGPQRGMMPGLGMHAMMNPMMMPRPMMPGMPMMPNMMMRPMMPMPGQPMQPGPAMPPPPMLCSMAATNMAAANNPVSIAQISNVPRVPGAPPPTINAPPPSKGNDYMTTPRDMESPLVQARLEMIRTATKMRVEPAPVDPLARRLSFRDKLVKVYSKVNPDRLGDIDSLLDKYAGREDKLYLGVLDKYECVVVKKSKKENSRDCDFRSGAPAKALSESSDSPVRDLKRPAPAYSVKSKSKRTSQDKTREFFKKQIKKIYKEHNPQKLGNLDALLDKYRGKERDVWLGICDKYGVRPE